MTLPQDPDAPPTCDHCQRRDQPIVLIEAGDSKVYAIGLCEACVLWALTAVQAAPALLRPRDIDTPETGA